MTVKIVRASAVKNDELRSNFTFSPPFFGDPIPHGADCTFEAAEAKDLPVTYSEGRP